MSIKYRTVSSCHAKMEFVGGEFLLSDLKSSNGTLVFVRQPVELAYGQLTHIKLGRTILTMQAKRSWTASTCIPQCLAACTSASQVQPVDDLPPGPSDEENRLNATWIHDEQPRHQEQHQDHAQDRDEEQEDSNWEENLVRHGQESQGREPEQHTQMNSIGHEVAVPDVSSVVRTQASRIEQ
jgi:hypothetical protein